MRIWLGRLLFQCYAKRAGMMQMPMHEMPVSAVPARRSASVRIRWRLSNQEKVRPPMRSSGAAERRTLACSLDRTGGGAWGIWASEHPRRWGSQRIPQPSRHVGPGPLGFQ
jgi:hypothetical protein